MTGWINELWRRTQSRAIVLWRAPRYEDTFAALWWLYAISLPAFSERNVYIIHEAEKMHSSDNRARKEAFERAVLCDRDYIIGGAKLWRRLTSERPVGTSIWKEAIANSYVRREFVDAYISHFCRCGAGEVGLSELDSLILTAFDRVDPVSPAKGIMSVIADVSDMVMFQLTNPCFLLPRIFELSSTRFGPMLEVSVPEKVRYPLGMQEWRVQTTENGRVALGGALEHRNIPAGMWCGGVKSADENGAWLFSAETGEFERSNTRGGDNK